MRALQVRGPEGVLVVDAAVALLVEPDAPRDDVGGDGQIRYARRIVGRHLADAVERMRVRGFEEPLAADGAVVAHRLVVAAVGNRTERLRVLDGEGRAALRSVGARGRVAENG